MMTACLIGMAALPFMIETAGQSLREVAIPSPKKNPASDG
jgi:hypothetical protein